MTKGESVRASLNSCNLDAAFITDSDSVFFFTGFKSSNALWVVTGKHELLFTDGRYFGAAQKFFAGSATEARLIPDSAVDWQTLFASFGVRKVGVNFDRITANRLRQYQRDFGVEVVDFSTQENDLRMQKTTAEIEGVHRACVLADKALKKTLAFLKGGIKETEFAWQLEKIGRDMGAEAVSFAPIVAFGDHTALPHHHPTTRKLRKNMPILIDWGFLVNGFASDCTRCFYYGKPDAEWFAVYEKVLAAQNAGIRQMRAGQPVGKPHEAAEKVLGEKMAHGFGHGIGVEVHEHPHVSPRGSGKFLDGCTATAEPGLYLEGKFGIRIEDVVAISAGEPRLLTAFPKGIEGAGIKI